MSKVLCITQNLLKLFLEKSFELNLSWISELWIRKSKLTSYHAYAIIDSNENMYAY